jgi:hypothetical protein
MLPRKREKHIVLLVPMRNRVDRENEKEIKRDGKRRGDEGQKGKDKNGEERETQEKSLYFCRIIKFCNGI